MHAAAPERVHVCDLLFGLTASVAPLANERRVAINLTSAEEDLFVHADLEVAQQILVTLVTNAVRSSPLGGMVRVAVVPTAETVTIIVADEGPASSPDLRDSIRLAEAMSGGLTAAPGPNRQGSVFSLRLRRL